MRRTSSKHPLAGLRMQADLAQREGASAEDLKQSLRRLARASIRATHSVNQLLALARAESSGSAMPRTRCDLAELCMSVVRDCVPFALEKHIDLGYEGTQAGNPGCVILANATLIKEMVRNLVDNAINYTPSSRDKPGVITARVLTDPVWPHPGVAGGRLRPGASVWPLFRRLLAATAQMSGSAIHTRTATRPAHASPYGLKPGKILAWRRRWTWLPGLPRQRRP
jgi:light-regulated signal transduction histidine kinase (bacteriophytochrome)